MKGDSITTFAPRLYLAKAKMLLKKQKVRVEWEGGQWPVICPLMLVPKPN